jgi:hypothetical protein
MSNRIRTWIKLPVCAALLVAVAGCAGWKTDYTAAKERAAAYVAAHPSLDSATATAIRNNRVAKGMTREQVVAAWGRPALVKRFRDGQLEQWFFGCDWPHSCNPPGSFREAAAMMADDYYDSQAYFENGVVTEVKG